MVVPGQGAEDLDIGIQTWLGASHHGAADTRLPGHQSDVTDMEGPPDPLVFEPALAIDIDQHIGPEATRIPHAVRVELCGGSQ
jgi:hypothetical protein